METISLSIYFIPCRTEENQLSLKPKAEQKLWKKFFTVRVVRHRNKLPKETVDITSLEELKTRLDMDLNNQV